MTEPSPHTIVEVESRSAERSPEEVALGLHKLCAEVAQAGGRIWVEVEAPAAELERLTAGGRDWLIARVSPHRHVAIHWAPGPTSTGE